MEEKLSGIVLGGVSYGENDKILSVYTLEKGAVSARIKGVKKAGAKLKFASEPFCFAEFVFAFSAGKRSVIGASLLDSFYPVRESIEKFYCASVITEFLKRFMKEEIVSPETFFLAAEGLKAIAYGKTSPESAVCSFLFSALELCGYALNLSGCIGCGGKIERRPFFDYASGGFYCENCFSGTGREINYSTFASLKKIAEGEGLESDAAIPVLKLLEYYISNKTDETLSSLKELIKL